MKWSAIHQRSSDISATAFWPPNGAGGHELIEPDGLSQTLERSERSRRIRQALRQIPRVYRRTLEDHFLHGYSVRRITRRDRVPVGTVLGRIFTGKRLLRQAWAWV